MSDKLIQNYELLTKLIKNNEKTTDERVKYVLENIHTIITADIFLTLKNHQPKEIVSIYEDLKYLYEGFEELCKNEMLRNRNIFSLYAEEYNDKIKFLKYITGMDKFSSNYNKVNYIVSFDKDGLGIVNKFGAIVNISEDEHNFIFKSKELELKHLVEGVVIKSSKCKNENNMFVDFPEDFYASELQAKQVSSDVEIYFIDADKIEAKRSYIEKINWFADHLSKIVLITNIEGKTLKDIKEIKQKLDSKLNKNRETPIPIICFSDDANNVKDVSLRTHIKKDMEMLEGLFNLYNNDIKSYNMFIESFLDKFRHLINATELEKEYADNINDILDIADELHEYMIDLEENVYELANIVGLNLIDHEEMEDF